MKKSTVFDILKRPGKIAFELRITEMRIEALENMLQGHAIRYDLDKVQTSPEDRVAEVVASMEELMKKRRMLQGAIATASDRSAALIDELPDEKSRLILYCRYTSGLSWRDTAAASGYEERQTYRIHDAAIDWLAENVKN